MKTMQDFKKEHMLKEYSNLGGLLKGKLQSTKEGIVIASRRLHCATVTIIETGKDNTGRSIFARVRDRREPILIGSIVKYQMINNDDAVILD